MAQASEKEILAIMRREVLNFSGILNGVERPEGGGGGEGQRLQLH